MLYCYILTRVTGKKRKRVKLNELSGGDNKGARGENHTLIYQNNLCLIYGVGGWAGRREQAGRCVVGHPGSSTCTRTLPLVICVE